MVAEMLSQQQQAENFRPNVNNDNLHPGNSDRDLQSLVFRKQPFCLLLVSNSNYIFKDADAIAHWGIVLQFVLVWFVLQNISVFNQFYLMLNILFHLINKIGKSGLHEIHFDSRVIRIYHGYDWLGLAPTSFDRLRPVMTS